MCWVCLASSEQIKRPVGGASVRPGVGATARTKEAAKRGGLSRGWTLFELGRNRAKLGIEGRAESVDSGDNRNRDARCNKAIFDSGGSGLVLQKGFDFGHCSLRFKWGRYAQSEPHLLKFFR